MSDAMDGLEALKVLSRARTDEIVVLSESCRQDWPPLSTRPELDIAITGSMGKASSFGLGVALGRPDVRVWVLDTDGALLMNLGSLVTIARAKPANLLHVVYDNDAYDTTGGQPTPGSRMADFRALARDAGYPASYRFDDVAALERELPSLLAGPRPALAVLKVASRGRRANMGMKRMYESFVQIKAYLATDNG
ncbi:MAG TPA: thiamine pyrophosphate-dependent enzyme [Chloroflexota bacterium]|nr:thiamine pyrophosphate-dependent enzyme [Chloroflexota bacterium]